MEYTPSEMGSPSFLILVSSPWNPEIPQGSSTLKPSGQKSIFMAGERFPSMSPVESADAQRSGDDAFAMTYDHLAEAHSPQPIPEAAKAISTARPQNFTFTPASTMASASQPSAIPFADADVRMPGHRSVPHSDVEPSFPLTKSSPPPRPPAPSNYQSAAAEAISRFRPTSRDVIIGLAPHLFDERARRPNDVPRSSLPGWDYDDRQHRPSPLRYTIDFDEEEEKPVPSVKVKKSLVSKLAEDFVFSEDKSPRVRVSSSNLVAGSHRASIIDINLDGTPKPTSRAKSSPDLKSASATPVPVTPEPAKPKSRLKRWTSFRKSSDEEKPKKVKKPKAAKANTDDDCGICYPCCTGECGQVTFAKYDKKERREKRVRSKTGSKRGFKDFRDSPEWKEFREAQAWTSRMEETKNSFEESLPEKPPTSRSKSESNLKDRYETTVTVVKAVRDSPDSTPEESPSSSSEDVSVVRSVDKDKFRWRSLGIGSLKVKIKSTKSAKAP